MRHARAMSSRTGGRYSYPVKAPQLDLSLHDELSMMEENDTLYQNDQFNVVFTSRTDHELETQLEEEGKEGRWRECLLDQGPISSLAEEDREAPLL